MEWISNFKSENQSSILIMFYIDAFLLLKNCLIFFWIWICSDGFRFCLLGKGHLNLSESEFFRWIQILHLIGKGHLNPSESEFFRWIQILYLIGKGHLNPSESEFFRWIQIMFFLLKGHLNPSESQSFQINIFKKVVQDYLNPSWPDCLKRTIEIAFPIHLYVHFHLNDFFQMNSGIILSTLKKNHTNVSKKNFLEVDFQYTVSFERVI